MPTPTTSPFSGTLPGVSLRGPTVFGCEGILSKQALEFVVYLERRFRPLRDELLARRADVQGRLDAGWKPDFPAETEAVRQGDWKVAPIPDDLSDRRVEITGPPERKMVINALNSGANVFMADFEDSTSPTWENVIRGQQNLFDAVRRQIDFVHPDTGKAYQLGEELATLVVRPRGWHLEEKHVWVDGRPVSAALFDFALYIFHNGVELIDRGTGPYFYLPKLESYREARLWNDVFVAAQNLLDIPLGTIRATVLVETVMAAFQMDEILYELRYHSAGLNCGRWDYIFSFIKRFRRDPACLLPDRKAVTMDQHFLRSYSLLLIQTCHKRGIHAMGGMAAQIPVRGDAARNDNALDNVRADKRREAGDGHDGTWVAHPGLVGIAREEFDRVMTRDHQFDRGRNGTVITAKDLLTVPEGAITEAGLRHNLDVGVRYLAAWLRGNGCVPIHDLMEDAATAEISRTQVWQWLHHGARLDDGRVIDEGLFRVTLDDELERIRGGMEPEQYHTGRYELAAALFERLILASDLEEFLTLPAYEHVLTLCDN